jgi:diketogulonate reductase-like aldo/keto reductase
MKLCDKEVSKIGLGTWKMGGGYWTPEYGKEQIYIEAIRYAISRGIKIIDTAEMYGGGHTEEIVGEAISVFDRESLFIITKVWNNHLRYDDVIKSAKGSLKRLKSKYIDLYLIHWPNPRVPLKETLSAMEKLIDMGIVRCIGVSNFDKRLLDEAIHTTSKYEILADEVEYSVYNLTPEKELIPFAEENGVKIIAYSPLGQGQIKYETKLSDIAKKYGKTQAQIALAYVMRKSIPIPKAVEKSHIDEITDSINITLSEEDIEEIRRRFL